MRDISVKKKPILSGWASIGDSGFLILRIETDCNAEKFTRKLRQHVCELLRCAGFLNRGEPLCMVVRSSIRKSKRSSEQPSRWNVPRLKHEGNATLSLS